MASRGLFGVSLQKRQNVLEIVANLVGDQISRCDGLGIDFKQCPQAVVAIHEDFIDAGAVIHTTNTYATNRHVLETSNEDENAQATSFDVPEANIKAVEVAREAISKQKAAGNNEKCWIAGSISNHPPFALRCDGHTLPFHEMFFGRSMVPPPQEYCQGGREPDDGDGVARGGSGDSQLPRAG